MASRQPTDEELRRVRVAYGQPTPGMVAAATGAMQDAGQPPEMRRDSGPTTEPIGDWRGKRLGPTVRPEAAREPAPAPSSGPSRRPPVSSSAGVAAERGVMPMPESIAPRETPGAEPAQPAAQDQPKDMHAFHYLGQVQAMEAKAMALGRPEEAARVREGYNQLIEGQFRSMETDWKTKTLPQVQAMQKMLLDHQDKQMPRELAMQARQLTQQAAQQQQQMLGFLYGLARNDATKPLGIKYFNESEMIQPGDKLADLVVENGMIVGVDEGGKPVQLTGGEDFRFPIQAAEQLYKSLFESDRKDNVILPKGGRLVNTNDGRVLADNPDLGDNRRDPTASDLTTASKQAAQVIATEFGATYDPIRQMMDESLIKDRASYTRALAEVESLVRSGVPALAAADQVAQKYRSAQATSVGTPGAYSGARPWRQ